MARPASEPSELELQVLGLLWRQGPMTARQVLEAMPDRKKRAYTSILSVLQVMEKKGLVAHDRPERALAHVFKPRVGRREMLAPLMRRMVQRVFAGSPAAAVQQLLSDTPVDREQIRQIRRMLDDLESGKPTDHEREDEQ